MPQDWDILTVQKATVRPWLWAQLSFPWATTNGCLHRQQWWLSVLSNRREASCIPPVTHKQACHMFLPAQMYFPTLLYTGPQLLVPRHCFSEVCHRNFITDCKIKFLVCSTTKAWPMLSDIGFSGVRNILLLVLTYIKEIIQFFM